MAQPFSFSLPPRDVPLTVRLQVLFGGFLNQFGWLFFGFGMVFGLANALLFLPQADVPIAHRAQAPKFLRMVGETVRNRPLRYSVRPFEVPIHSPPSLAAASAVIELSGRSPLALLYTTNS